MSAKTKFYRKIERKMTLMIKIKKKQLRFRKGISRKWSLENLIVTRQIDGKKERKRMRRLPSKI